MTSEACIRLPLLSATWSRSNATQFNGHVTPLQALVDLHADVIHGFYVHTPFCVHKCHYCDFYSLAESGKSDSTRHEAFARRLIREITLRCASRKIKPHTIFIGGGTPTLLSAKIWNDLLATFRVRGLLERVGEFTVEANPETVHPELCDVLVRGGVNRVSLGAQSFQPKLLRTLERWHEPASVRRAVRAFRAAGVANINLDLIFAIPGQTLESLHADLEAALAMSPEHLSCYSLTYEPDTAMTQRLRMGEFQPASESLEKEMYRLVMERLAAAGYEHYEISNWARWKDGQLPWEHEMDCPARSSYRCRHNLLYWRNGNWLGVGPSAASHVAGHRWKNLPHLGRYLTGEGAPPITDYEHLPPPRQQGEQLMMGLRLREGILWPWLDVCLAPNDPRRRSIEQFVRVGLLERSSDRLRLSERGRFVADGILAELL